MNRPWREIVEASRMSAEEEEEDTEAAIREALKEALEQPGEEGASTGRFQEQLRSQHDEHPRSDVGWDPFAPRDMQPHLAAGEAHDEADEAENDRRRKRKTPIIRPSPFPDMTRSRIRRMRTRLRSDLTGLSARRAVYKADDGERTKARTARTPPRSSMPGSSTISRMRFGPGRCRSGPSSPASAAMTRR